MSCTSMLSCMLQAQECVGGVSNFDQILLLVTMVNGLLAFVSLFFVNAPYGKFQSSKFGPKINGSVGFALQEAPSFFSFLTVAVMYFKSNGEQLLSNSDSWGPLLFKICFSFMFLCHYSHRSFIYPFKSKIPMNDTTILVVSLAALFTTINGYLNARFIFYYQKELYDFSNPLDPKNILFIIGFILFWIGFYINYDSDNRLIELRNKKFKQQQQNSNANRYFIPYGGMFNYISCANYFGELVEWFGFALCTQTCAASGFVLFSFLNLFPRALKTHQWYKDKFGSDYPTKRKAIIPFII